MTPDPPTSWPAPAVPDLQPGLPNRATDPIKLTRGCFGRLNCRLPFFWFQRQFFDFLRFFALNNAKKRTVDFVKTSYFSVFNLTSSFGFVRFFRFFFVAQFLFFFEQFLFFFAQFLFFFVQFLFFFVQFSFFFVQFSFFSYNFRFFSYNFRFFSHNFRFFSFLP